MGKQTSEVSAIKSKLQKEAFDKWIKNNGRGAVEWATGVGKTRVAVSHVIPYVNSKKKPLKTDIIVPRIPLKEDWESHVSVHNLKNCSVYVGNTYGVLKRECDLLVVDEAHRFLNEETKVLGRIIKNTKWRGILLLSASFEQEHYVLLKKFNIPIIHRVSLKEAYTIGITSQYTIYNLGLIPNSAFRQKEEDVINKFKHYSSKFNHDMKLAFACAKYPYPKKTEDGGYEDPVPIIYARRMGWRGISAEQAFYNVIKRKNTPHGKKGTIDIWEDRGSSHPYSPSKINVYAVNYIKFMTERKKLYYNADIKLETAINLLNKFSHKKTLVFSQTTHSADVLHSHFPKESAVYHSNLKSKYLYDKDGNIITYKNGKPRKFGKDSLQKKALSDFKEDRVRILLSALALDEGVDVPNCDMGIIISFTSKARQNIQRVGRIIRALKGKNAFIINLFIKSTDNYVSQDEKWLSKSQKGSINTKWISSIDEIGETLNII